MSTHRRSVCSLAPMVSLAFIVACGGGGGGGGSNPPPPVSGKLLFSATTISPLVSIRSGDGGVYLGSQHALSALDGATGAYLPLAGELVGHDPALPGLGVVEHPTDFVRSGDWLYFHSWGYRIQRLFLGMDGKGTIQTVVPQKGLGQSCCQLEDLATDEQRAYWAISDGSTSSIYARLFAGGEARLLATVSGEARLTPAPSRLYVLTASMPGSPAVRAVDLATNTVETIQEGVALNVLDGELPNTASSTQLFWMDGTTLRSVAHGATAPEVVATGLARIRRLATDGDAVYALQDGPPQATILRIDLVSHAIETIVTRDDIRALLAYQGRVWWLSGLTLEASNTDGSNSSLLYATDGSDIVFGGAGGAKMFGVSGRVVAGSGELALLLYDIAGASGTVLTPLVGATHVAADSSAVYAASHNDGIARIPVDVPLRTPETLRGGLATIETMFLDQDWLYWSEWSGFAQVYRISRMRTDGSGYQILFDGDHRGLLIQDGRLLFMCEVACSLPGWTIVSMPLSGGTITPIVTTGAFPQQLILRNGLLYLLDTVDGRTFGVWSIDVAGRRSAQLVRDLPLTGIEIDASPKWLYVWTSACPDRGCGDLSRQAIESWDRVGAPQSVDPRSGPQSWVYPFHSDGTDLYYWVQDEGLKKLPE